ncbi:MAG: tRNA pseudouridine(38-40) synthase TruA [Simkaniaceae bacterium]
MINYKMTLSYEGAPFFGWQKTLNHPTIEGCLEKALLRLFGFAPSLQAASRTDRGVHALGQVVNFLAPEIDCQKIKFKLNHLLPESIQVFQVEKASPLFHPTLDNKGKEYHYRVTIDPIQSPEMRFYAWHYFYPIDRNKLQKAKELFIGIHDFSPLSNQTTPSQSSRKCHLFSIDIEGDSRHLIFKIRGDRFLYKMVRNLVGTLIQMGSNKISLSTFPLNRQACGMTAPAHGLYLYKVFY